MKGLSGHFDAPYEQVFWVGFLPSQMSELWKLYQACIVSRASTGSELLSFVHLFSELHTSAREKFSVTLLCSA
jgi:hypothetical protein